MGSIKRIPRAVGVVAALGLAAACDTLEVANPNAPDTGRALGDPATVQAIAAGALRTWFNTTQNMDPDGILVVGADSHTAPWNNFQIRFYTGCTTGPLAPPFPPGPLGTCGTTVNTIPRIEWQNNPAAAERVQIEVYWYGYYSALSSASDVVKAIRVKNLVITDAPTTKMVETVAVLVQGLSLAGLALNYDKAFIVDENTPIDANGLAIITTFSNRAAVRDAALAKFDNAIALAKANTFTVPGSFFGDPKATAGNPFAATTYTNVKLAQIANTMAARTLAYFPRSAAENATVDWARVASYADSGISATTTSGGLAATRFDLVFQHDGCVNWCDNLKAWSNDMRTMRIHTRVAHLMDPTTQPHPFDPATNSQPVWTGAGRTSFDKRLGDGTYTYPNAAAGNRTITPAQSGNGGTDYAWSTTAQRFPSARGQWRQSAIGQIRYITLSEIDPNGSAFGFGASPIVLAAENDLLWAEGLIRSGGNAVTAAGLINNTRVGRGGLAPLTGAETQAQLLAALQYEQDVELPGSNVAPFYNQRRIDGLEPLTPHEMPVPAKELGVLQQPLYTWGGATNPPNSPSSSAGTIAALQVVLPQWPRIEQQLLLQARVDGAQRRLQ